jgi:hypothetical protein
MKRVIAPVIFVIALALLGMSPHTAQAQVGKLSGTVTDADTGDPLPGVNVVLVGTQRGAATNPDGFYTIIGIDPGSYSVRFTLVGYEPTVVENVRISANRTRTLDVELGEGVLEGEEVVVTAQQPVVQPDQTASQTAFTSEEIEQLPVSDLSDVISNTAKSYDGFVRGSRRFSTKTVVEGIDLSDEWARASSINENTRAGYGSTIRIDEVNKSGLMNLNASGLEEVSVSTGATPASAPAGSGGVISATLKEGRGPWTGDFSFRLAPTVNQPGPDSLAIYPDAEVEAYFNERQQILEGGDELRAGLYTWSRDKYDIREAPEVTANASLGGSITENWGLAVSGQLFQTEGYLPNTFRRRVNAQLKSSYDLSSETEITAVALVEDRGLWGGWNNRNYSELWRYYLEGTAQDDGGSYVGSLRLRRVLGDNSFITVQVYRKYARTRYGYPDDDGNGFVDRGEDGAFINFLRTENIARYNWIRQGPPEEKMFYGGPFPPGRSDQVLNPRGEPIRAAGPMPYYEDATRATNAIKVDYSNQITPNHLIQAGVELRLMNYDYEETRSELFEFDFTLNNTLDVNDDGVLDVEPFLPSTWERSPTQVSLYLSDQIEYGDLIVDLGLRTDIVDRDTRQINDHFYPFRRDTINVDGRTVARNFFDRGDKVPTDVFWNPRVGVSHPIGSRAAVYFSYARSEELVPFSTLYDFYDGNHSANRFLVYQDPAQDPIVSNSYELGAQWEFVEGWGLDVNAYARSVANYGRVTLIANNRVPEGEPSLRGLNQHRFQTSGGYADIRGLELQLQRRPLQIAPDVTLGLTASYTFSTVETARFADNQTRFTADEEQVEDNQLPFDNVDQFQNFPQGIRGGNSVISNGFNRRHRGLLRAVGRMPYDISLGIDARAESGFLFEKVVDADPRDRELVTAPANFRVDLRLQKRFRVQGTFGVNLFVDVKNLTNRNNIVAYNDQAPDGTQRMQVENNPGERLILIDGSPIYGPARNIYFGTQINF